MTGSDTGDREPLADGMAGADKAVSFVERVRLGENIERIKKQGVELSVMKTRALELADCLQAAIIENDAIAAVLEKERSGR